MAENFDIGEAIYAAVVFKDAAGDPADPATAPTASYRKGDGTRVTVDAGAIEHTGTGAYRFPVTPDVPGIWWHRWAAEGANGVIVEEGSFLVRVRRVAAAS